MSTLQNMSEVANEPEHYHDPDEINLLEYVYAIVKHKKLIIIMGVFGFVLGTVFAYIKGPVWESVAVIAPLESESQKTPSFSGFGALGGIVANQMNLSGNASLEKIELLLNSRSFNAQLLERNNFVPQALKILNPKAYKNIYDVNGKPKQGVKLPNSYSLGRAVASKFLTKKIDDNKTMTLTVATPDSAFSDTLLKMYISYLGEYIRTTTQNDAKENVKYLENRLQSVSDPLLREKIQGLIANEIEKMMVVSKNAFKIIDLPYLSMSFRVKKLYPVAFSFVFFFFTVVAIILKYSFTLSDRTPEDADLIERIKKELGRI